MALPGQARGVAAPDAAGPLIVTGIDGGTPSRTVLTAVDLSGAVLWQHEIDGHPLPALVSSDRTVWQSRGEPDSGTLTELDLTGSVVRTVVLEHQPHEHLGAFVRLEDGFCAAWLPAARNRIVPPDRFPRVTRLADDGATLWSTTVRFDAHGVVDREELRTIETSYQSPLLVSGDRALVTYADGSSGMSVSYFLDTTDGRIVAETSPGPSGINVIVAPGEFLIGHQGYGEFRTTRHDRSGATLQSWPSHGMLLVDRHGAIRGPEHENVLPSRSRFRELADDGTLRDGPPLSGYHTTYPALDDTGTAVFWRDGQLLAVDADFHSRTLFAAPDDRTVMSRVLLLDEGRVAFALHGELLMFTRTGLGPLDTGCWPCGTGNTNGNPVAYEGTASSAVTPRPPARRR
jgi:hypothetical protein